MTEQKLDDLIVALENMADIEVSGDGAAPDAAVYTGSGDSLASAYVASRTGGRAMSSGDIQWMEEVPAQAKTLVGISNSGTSGATIRALRRGAEEGLRTIAVTSSPDSVMAKEASEVQLIAPLDLHEDVPVAGHIVLALGVAAAAGYDTTGAGKKLAEELKNLKGLIEDTVEALPAELPAAMTILSLPELRSAGNFFTLKLMEATGAAARDVPLEESGHVDYFIGPQPHLVLSMIGTRGKPRFERLEQALSANGQTCVSVDLSAVADGDNSLEADLVRDLAGAVVATFVSIGAAKKWNRPPFRGGEVNMDASHIKIEI